MAEVKVTKDNFQKEVIESDVPVLLDFGATWCGPCRMIAPVIAKIEEELDGQVKVGKIDVDEEVELASQFKIVSIPTLKVVKNGEVTATSVGFQKEDEIKAML